MKIEELSIGNFVLYEGEIGVFKVIEIRNDGVLSILPHGMKETDAFDHDIIYVKTDFLRPVFFDSYHINKQKIAELNDLCGIVSERHMNLNSFVYNSLHSLQNAHIAAYGEPIDLSGCIIDQPETKPETEPVKDMDYVIKRLDEIVKWFEERGH